jgi:Putative transposase
MTERAAHLVDAVLPWVPVRQWVLTVPYRLRYQMAWNHGLSRAVLGVYTRALGDVYARGARARGIEGGQTGMVTALQRAGGALNANVHFHTLVLDGVFTEAPGGALAFHPAPAPSDAEVAAAVATIRRRVQRLLVRHGLEPGDDATAPADRLAEESPVLPGIVGASVQGRVALGKRAGARVRRLGDARDTEAVTSRGPRQAHLEGFDVHGNVWVSANERAGWSVCAATCCVRIACRSAGPVLPTREVAANVRCGIGASWGGRRPSLADYVTVTGATRGAIAAEWC